RPSSRQKNRNGDPLSQRFAEGAPMPDGVSGEVSSETISQPVETRGGARSFDYTRTIARVHSGGPDFGLSRSKFRSEGSSFPRRLPVIPAEAGIRSHAGAATMHHTDSRIR